MKNTIILGFLCLLLGIAIGWIGKPGELQDTKTARGAEAFGDRPADIGPDNVRPARVTPADSAAPAKKAATRPMILGGGGISPGQLENFSMNQEKIGEAMKQQQRAKLERALADLVKELGLDSAQEAALRGIFEKKLGALDGIFGAGGGVDPVKMMELSELLQGKKLDPEMLALLNPDQVKAYETMKTEERARRVDAKALKELAKLSGSLSLTPEQRDSVYQVLHEQAGRQADTPSPTAFAMGMSLDGVGLELDLEDSGLTEMLTFQAQAGKDGQNMDPAALLAKSRERAAQRIEEKVALLSGILDEEQTARYREQLTTKSEGLLNGALLGVGGGEGQDGE